MKVLIQWGIGSRKLDFRRLVDPNARCVHMYATYRWCVIHTYIYTYMFLWVVLCMCLCYFHTMPQMRDGLGYWIRNELHRSETFYELLKCPSWSISHHSSNSTVYYITTKKYKYIYMYIFTYNLINKYWRQLKVHIHISVKSQHSIVDRTTPHNVLNRML